MSLLSVQQQDFLQTVARQAVFAAVAQEPPPNFKNLAEAAKLPLQGLLTEKRGAFVTLTLQERLRGCIGYIEGFKPLVEAVAENGRSAAVADPRFSPVQTTDLSQLEIEVSVLTPLLEVLSYEHIEVGKHGVLLEKNGQQAVFLPQVATEQGWDLPTTLTQLALKAGLGPLEWQRGTKFKIFEAQIF